MYPAIYFELVISYLFQIKRKVKVIIAVILLGLLILSTTGYNIVVVKSRIVEKPDTGNSENTSEYISVLSSCDFDSGKWQAFIYVHCEDMFVDDWMLSRRLYQTSDVALPKKMKNEWVFTCGSADIATVQSKILFFQDGELKYESGMVLEKSLEGLQTPQCGWLDAKNHALYKYCKEFKPVYWPIVVL
ncbi:MAG: hypothetical protein AAF741_03180 [Bacteroidota bacterium]